MSFKNDNFTVSNIIKKIMSYNKREELMEWFRRKKEISLLLDDCENLKRILTINIFTFYEFDMKIELFW